MKETKLRKEMIKRKERSKTNVICKESDKGEESERVTATKLYLEQHREQVRTEMKNLRIGEIRNAALTCTYTHTRTHTYIHTYTNTQTNTATFTHTHTHTHIYAHTHTHTRTRAHTHLGAGHSQV